MTPATTLEKLEAAIGEAKVSRTAPYGFVSVDSRVLAWLILDSRAARDLLAALKDAEKLINELMPAVRLVLGETPTAIHRAIAKAEELSDG